MRAWENAIAEHRYDDATVLVGNNDLTKVEAARRMATSRATHLRGRIVASSKSKEFRQLLHIREDPETTQLLALLPEAVAEDAQQHLDDAVVWRTIQEEVNTRRIKKANSALADFDLGLSKALIRKIDSEFLTDKDRSTYDELLLGITARSMEGAEVRDAVGPLLDPPDPSKRRWWKR
jgi:hypothetical protein